MRLGGATMKSFSQSHEAIPKQNGAYRRISKTGTGAMQFILDLLWDLSRSASLAAIARREHSL
jgi:hypothetical protein